jgi:hypothetical protein
MANWRKKDKNKNTDGLPSFLDLPANSRANMRRARAAANYQFRPSQRQLNQEMSASREQSARMDDWFNQYRQNLGAVQKDSDAAYGAAQDRAAANQQGSFDRAEALRSRLAAEDRRDALNRGAVPDAGSNQQYGQAMVARDQTQSAFDAQLNSQRAAQDNYLRNRQAITEREQINQQGEEAARYRALQGRGRELAAQRGDFMTNYLRQAQLDDREFWTKRADIASSGNYADAMRDVARMGQHKTVDVNNSYWGAGGGSGGGSGGSSGTRAEAMAGLRQNFKMKALRNNPAARRDAYDWLISEGYPKKMVRKIIGGFKSSPGIPGSRDTGSR